MADILDPIYVPNIVNSFFLMNSVLNYQGTSKPFLAVQVTELDDGIFIGCTLNHCVVNSSSYWHFFNTWSEILTPHHNLLQFSNVVILMVILISHFIFLSITMKSLIRGPFLLPWNKRSFIFRRKKFHSKQKPMLKWAQTTSRPFKQYWVISSNLWFAIGVAAVIKRFITTYMWEWGKEYNHHCQKNTDVAKA